MTGEFSQTPLREQLEQRKQQGAAKVPPEVTALRKAETEKLIWSGIAEQSLHERNLAPDFTLPDANAQPVTLLVLCQKDPVIVTFYRGSWCSYCNLQLRVYQAILPEIIPHPAMQPGKSKTVSPSGKA